MKKVLFSLVTLGVSGNLFGMQPLSEGSSSSSSLAKVSINQPGKTLDLHRYTEINNPITKGKETFSEFDKSGIRKEIIEWGEQIGEERKFAANPIINLGTGVSDTKIIRDIIDDEEYPEEELLKNLQYCNDIFQSKPLWIKCDDLMKICWVFKKFELLKFLIEQTDVKGLNEFLRYMVKLDCKLGIASKSKKQYELWKNYTELVIKHGANNIGYLFEREEGAIEHIIKLPYKFQWLVERTQEAGLDITYSVRTIPFLKRKLKEEGLNRLISPEDLETSAEIIKEMENIARKQPSFGKNTDLDSILSFRDYCSKRDTEMLRWFLDAGFDVTRDITLIPYVESIVKEMEKNNKDSSKLEEMKKILKQIKEKARKFHEENTNNSDVFIGAFESDSFHLLNEWLDAGFLVTDALVSKVESSYEKNIGGFASLEDAGNMIKKIKSKLANSANSSQNSENITDIENVQSDVEEDSISEFLENKVFDYLENLDLSSQNTETKDSPFTEQRSVFSKPVIKAALGGAAVIGGGIITYYALNGTAIFGGAGNAPVYKEFMDYIIRPTWNRLKQKAKTVLHVLTSKKVLIPAAGTASVFGLWYWLNNSDSNLEEA